MQFRACIAVVAAALLLLLGPAAAQASHGFSVSKTEAAAGEELEFQIAGTQAGESYIVKVEDQEVASGVDQAGNGVTDKFKMPDFGGASRAVSVEVDITPPNGDVNHKGSWPMQYLVAASGSPGPPAPQPEPVRTIADPVTVPEPQIATPPAAKEDKPSKGKDTSKGKESKPEKTGTPTSEPTTSDPTPAPVTSTGGGDSSSGISSGSSSTSTGSGAGLASPVPPGPTGPTSPIGSSIASVLSPLSGIAEPGKTGFPILLIVLAMILIALALTAAGPRLWQRYQPALPWGPEVDDETRLTALGRASASGAELQQTIAARKASRSNGSTGRVPTKL